MHPLVNPSSENLFLKVYSSNVIEWAKVEMEWALQVARAHEGGVMSDEWNRFLVGQGIDLGSKIK